MRFIYTLLPLFTPFFSKKKKKGTSIQSIYSFYPWNSLLCTDERRKYGQRLFRHEKKQIPIEYTFEFSVPTIFLTLYSLKKKKEATLSCVHWIKKKLYNLTRESALHTNTVFLLWCASSEIVRSTTITDNFWSFRD